MARPATMPAALRAWWEDAYRQARAEGRYHVNDHTPPPPARRRGYRGRHYR